MASLFDLLHDLKAQLDDHQVEGSEGSPQNLAEGKPVVVRLRPGSYRMLPPPAPSGIISSHAWG